MTAARILLLLLLVLAVWIVVDRGGAWLDQIGDFSWDPSWPSLTASFVLLGLSYYSIPLGWGVLSRKAGCRAGTGELRNVWFVSQLGRYVPGKIWLFAGRAAFLKSRGLSGFRATSVPFLELLYTAAGAGLAALPFALFSTGSVFSSTALKGAVVTAGASLLVVPFLRPLQRWLYGLKYGRSPEELPLPRFAVSMGLLLFYAANWLVRGVSLYLWITGFGIGQVSLPVCLAAAPLSWLAGYIVFLVPGGVGIREAVATAMLASSGQTGPFLAVIAGERLILSVFEVSFALAGARGTGLVGKRGTN
ncbi:MAG: hypothetical protein AVO35_08120 [Candidatus Aegiribacteria sp. MLS_C]|nr:MAG: hypothetical protein AVO35_08120 [Candidatus Aegiribacteria sp. MLS_C]